MVYGLWSRVWGFKDPSCPGSQVTKKETFGVWYSVLIVSGSECSVQGFVQRFRGGLVFKAHRLVYHSSVGLRVIKKRRRITEDRDRGAHEEVVDAHEVVLFFSSVLLSSVALSDTKYYEP